MKYLHNISRIHNCRNRFGIEHEVWDIFLCHFFSCSQHLKITKLITRENFGSTKYLREKNLGCTKCPRERTLDPRNTLEKKFGTHEIPTRKYLEPTKNTHVKKFSTHEIPTKARWHGGTRPTRPTMARDPRTSAHSLWNLKISQKHKNLDMSKTRHHFFFK